MNSDIKAVLTVSLAALMASQAVMADDSHVHQASPQPNTDVVANQSNATVAGMQKMRQQMEAIHAAKDSQTRAKLMEEHMQTMQSTLQSMHGSGCAMMGKGMAMKNAQAADDSNMMQMMMEQMMQHQKAMQSMDK